MTKKIHVHLIDDLDASEASETLRFGVDGMAYEIDLSSRNAQRFRADIAPYIGHARRMATHARRRGRAGPGAGRPGVEDPAWPPVRPAGRRRRNPVPGERRGLVRHRDRHRRERRGYHRLTGSTAPMECRTPYGKRYDSAG